MKQFKSIFPRYSLWQTGIFHLNWWLPVRCGILTLLILSSCNPDDDCITTATRDDYLGIWLCDETQNSQPPTTFQVEILKHPSDNSKVLIDNFNQLGVGIQAEAIINNTEISLDPSILVDGNTVSGNGFICKLNIIEFQYTIDDGGGQPEIITATYTK